MGVGPVGPVPSPQPWQRPQKPPYPQPYPGNPMPGYSGGGMGAGNPMPGYSGGQMPLQSSFAMPPGLQGLSMAEVSKDGMASPYGGDPGAMPEGLQKLAALRQLQQLGPDMPSSGTWGADGRTGGLPTSGTWGAAGRPMPPPQNPMGGLRRLPPAWGKRKF